MKDEVQRRGERPTGSGRPAFVRPSSFILHPSSFSPSRRGFTLLELLVVISIIAIIVGITLPTLAAARQRAIKIACMSNLRQVGMGIRDYQDRYGGVFPTARYMPEPFISGDNDPPLPDVLKPHLAGFDEAAGRVYRCPGDDVIFPLAKISYMYQSELSGQRIEEFFPVKIFKAPPAEVVVARDFDGGIFDTSNGQIEAPMFHRLRNLLFADGRVGNF